MGTGIVNFLFAIPAIYTIDTFGRRNLLLVTFPLMALCLCWCGFSFLIPNGAINPDTGMPDVPTGKLGSIAAAIFTFMAVYSPGEGPVPFTYSAEAFPLYIRDIGMSFATATTWGFNFIISLTWPSLQVAFTPTGAFCWYAGWNLFGWVFCYFMLPETKVCVALRSMAVASRLTVCTRTSRSKSWTMSSPCATGSTPSTTPRSCRGI